MVKAKKIHNKNYIHLFKNMGVDLLLLILSVILFTLAFPNSLVISGIFPLAYIAFIPLFLVVHRSNWIMIAVYGAIYGYASYFCFNNWLGAFHPLALLIVPVIYCVYFLFFFPVLKLLDTFFPRCGYLLQALAWVIFEYARTLGFLGYSYGILGYTQYPFIPLIKIADITGIWGVVLLVIFPSALISWCFKDGFNNFITNLKRQVKVIISYAFVFALVLFYGFFSYINIKKIPTWRVALIQQNYDPWKDGDIAYKRSLEILIKLSKKAMLENPDIVIWSETSFVPAIQYHMQYRQDQVRYDLVKELLDFLALQPVPFVIGNGQGELIKIGTNEEERVDYNAVILFINGKAVNTYRKIHLVPFTEHFPYKEQFPQIYKLLEKADTHYWRKGSEYTVFNVDGIRFSTPICFEDTFGSLCATFVKQGADVLVNMTNDLWSKSEAAEVQHMTMALFRAVENNRTLVRSTNGGITCVVDPNGKILKDLKPFTEDFLVHDIPLYKGEKTFYCLYGDWFPVVVVLIFLIIVSALLITRILKKRN